MTSECSWTIPLEHSGVLATVFGLAVGFVVFSALWRTDQSYVPWAPSTMLETISSMSHLDAPFFLLRQWRLAGFDVFRVRLPVPGGFWVVTDWNLAKQVLKDSTSEKPASYQKGQVVVGGPSIFNSPTKSPNWKISRKATAPAFSSMEIARMNEICRENIERWISEVLDPLVKECGTMDPGAEMIKLTFRVICESAFEYYPSDEEIASFTENLDLALREFVMRQLNNPFRQYYAFLSPQWYEAHAAVKKMASFAKKIIEAYEERKASGKASSSKTVIRLILSNPNINEQVRISDILTYIIAGHDTTGYTISNTLTMLAEHPTIATELQQELLQTPKEKWDQVGQLQNVIQEVHRLLPVAGLGSLRSLEHDLDCEIDGRHICIPKGSNINLNMVLIHRNEKVFSNADQFDPSRWSKSTPEMKQSLMPFSLGNRNCIGQTLATAEIQAVIPRLLAGYDFELVKKGEVENFFDNENCRISSTTQESCYRMNI